MAGKRGFEVNGSSFVLCIMPRAEATADSSSHIAARSNLPSIMCTSIEESAIAVSRYPLERVYMPLRNSGERFRWKVPNAVEAGAIGVEGSCISS